MESLPENPFSPSVSDSAMTAFRFLAVKLFRSYWVSQDGMKTA
jgi:hypothetical protein